VQDFINTVNVLAERGTERNREEQKRGTERNRKRLRQNRET
jgi:hypothetical protein